MRKNEQVSDFFIDFKWHNEAPENMLCNSDHCHERYEILYVADAYGSYVIEGAEYELSPGVIMLIKPFAYHHANIDPRQGNKVLSVYFTKDFLSEQVSLILDGVLDGEGSGRFYPSYLHDENIYTAFDRFSLAEKLPKEQGRAFVLSLLSEIIILLSAVEGKNICAASNCLGARASRYINDNITKNIGLDRLAKKFFVSKYHLCRAFKEYNGISVHSYINHKRIMYAKQLIESGVTASGAAERVGFGDYSAFYRAYVKIVGKSPTAN